MPFGRNSDGGSSAERGEKSSMGKFHCPAPSGKGSPSKFNRTPTAAAGQGNNNSDTGQPSEGQTYPSR